MSFETIRYDVAAGVATLTLDRPEVRNGLNAPMRRELVAAIARAGHEARALILTGAGRAFCSGQDLAEARAMGDPDFGKVLREEYEPLLAALDDCPIPTLAAVNGAAAGAGANLALAADVVIAARSAVFVQAFSRIGLIPDAGGTWTLPRRIGMARAMGAALFAEPIPAETAAAWGMIWETAPDEDFAAVVAARAAQLAAGPPSPTASPARPCGRARPRTSPPSSPSRRRSRTGPAAPAIMRRGWRPSWRNAPPGSRAARWRASPRASPAPRSPTTRPWGRRRRRSFPTSPARSATSWPGPPAARATSAG